MKSISSAHMNVIILFKVEDKELCFHTLAFCEGVLFDPRRVDLAISVRLFQREHVSQL